MLPQMTLEQCLSTFCFGKPKWLRIDMQNSVLWDSAQTVIMALHMASQNLLLMWRTEKREHCPSVSLWWGSIWVELFSFCCCCQCNSSPVLIYSHTSALYCFKTRWIQYSIRFEQKSCLLVVDAQGRTCWCRLPWGSLFLPDKMRVT